MRNVNGRAMLGDSTVYLIVDLFFFFSHLDFGVGILFLTASFPGHCQFFIFALEMPQCSKNFVKKDLGELPLWTKVQNYMSDT